jgi:sirohydrochlorin ferrochelatase
VRAEAVEHVREMILLQRELTGRDVVVVPVLMAPGRVSRKAIPKGLGGLPVVYGGETLLPHPGMARWVEARVRGDPCASHRRPVLRGLVRQSRAVRQW